MNESMDRALADWLLEGPEHGPREGLDRALVATRRVPQRPGWTLLERWIPMDMTVARTPSSRPLLVGLAALLLIAAVAGTILLVGAPRRALPPPFGPAGNGSIVFARDGDLFVADALTAAPRPLVTDAAVDTVPAYSQQGDAIAFLRADAGGAQRLMRVAADGSGLHELAGPFPTVDRFSWSPDGSSLLIGFTDDAARLAVVDAAGGGTKILDLPVAPDWPSWRPDGQTIAFRGHALARVEPAVYLADADGANVRRLDIPTDQSEWEDFWGVTWSPDGDRLIYTRQADLGGFIGWQLEIADIAPDGTMTATRDLPLAPEATTEMFPVWSPDGSRVAFILERHGARQVAIARADGVGDVLPVGPEFPAGAGGFSFSWSPDGQALLVSHVPRVGDQRLWAANVADGTSTEIANLSRDVPSWQRVAP
jgi:Tol biopolymer transport system component